jgi:hypothetical protein
MKTTIWDDRDVQGYWGAKRLHQLGQEERLALHLRVMQVVAAGLVVVYAVGRFF